MKKPESGKKENITIRKTISFFGGIPQLSESLKVDRSHISRWLYGDRPIPIKHAIKVEELTHGKIKAKELRPDVFNQTKEVTKK